MTDWKKVYSSSESRPSELDTFSSQTTVYQRRNITQEVVKDEMGDTEGVVWTYEERQMSKEEYAALNSPVTQMMMQNLSDIEADLLALTLGV